MKTEPAETLDEPGSTKHVPSDSDFEEAYGEPLENTLNLDTWTAGEDMASLYTRLEQEIGEAISKEEDYQRTIRRKVFPQISAGDYAPPNAGVYQVTTSQLQRVHEGLLFNGGVEACDGTSVVHDTLPLTITQLGIALVSYNGQQGTWTHRFYRRDLRSKQDNPVEEVLTLLRKREDRGGQGQDSDRMSDLARRGIMAFAERAILKQKSSATWRMGHGSPAPYELITGLWASQKASIAKSLDLIRWYVLEHKRFIFVPSAPSKRLWLTIGSALRPREFAILQTLRPELETIIDNGNYREGSGVLPAMEAFRDEIADKVVVGAYRVWEAAPPYIFYAHVDYAELAAHIVMADSMLQEYRGFPMLIDLADRVCSASFGTDSFYSTVQMAYARAGQPFRYLGERETRTK